MGDPIIVIFTPFFCVTCVVFVVQVRLTRPVQSIVRHSVLILNLE